MFQNYEEVMAFLFKQLPMYQRVGNQAFKKDLKNIIALCNLLGNPQEELKCIHVAGTNGKGSVCHILGSLLQEDHLKVGIYSSPHFKDFRERIKINGSYIAEQEVLDFINLLFPKMGDLQPSFFEWSVAMAFWYFKKENVDIAIIETGLGGRLDSTNIITPLLSVITNISLDHQHMLGETLEAIAREKAGIIKKNRPVVIGRNQEETKNVFETFARVNTSELFYADKIVDIEKTSGTDIAIVDTTGRLPAFFSPDLKGDFQLENYRTALASWLVYIHRGRGSSSKAPRDLKESLENVSSRTRFFGRWQIMGETPLTIADGCHNLEGMKQGMSYLMHLRPVQLHLVLGFVKDKNLDGIMEVLPKSAVYYFVRASVPRAMPAKDLQSLAAKHGLSGEVYDDVISGLESAKTKAGNDDVIFIGGSMFVVAEVL